MPLKFPAQKEKRIRVLAVVSCNIAGVGCHFFFFFAASRSFRESTCSHRSLARHPFHGRCPLLRSRIASSSRDHELQSSLSFIVNNRLALANIRGAMMNSGDCAHGIGIVFFTAVILTTHWRSPAW